MKQNPCKDCVPPKRHLGCHDRCPERAEWLAEEELKKAARSKDREERIAMREYKEFASKRMRWGK